MSSFISDMLYQGCLQGVATGQRDRKARVLALVHADVPCKEELLVTGKTTAVPITILRVLQGGFGQAPYTAAKQGSRPPPLKEGEVFENLFEVVKDHETDGPSSLNLWSYVSKGNIQAQLQLLNSNHKHGILNTKH